MKKILIHFITFLFILIFTTPLQAAWQQQILSQVQNGAVLAVDESGKVLFSYHANQRYVPASTLKVATALAALKILGSEYRYQTAFFKDKQDNLYIKGYGDPFLISEELALMASKLKQQGLQSVRNIILDGSYFAPDVQVHGLAASLNPYDAYNGALLANFNTIYIIKGRDGSIHSAEPQTPITEISRSLASRAPVGKSRINVATHPREAALYVGYLLKEFLKREGVSVSGSIRSGLVDGSAKKFYTYQSSKDLKAVLIPALKYSQNLIMNQLFLTMGAKKLGAPATLEKSRRVLQEFLKKDLGIPNIQVEEGSGISRKNKVTALELDQVLVKFFPYYQLLPQKNGMWVKTGTLRGVASLIGYFKSPSHGWVRFVILLNQPGNRREKIAQILKANL